MTFFVQIFRVLRALKDDFKIDRSGCMATIENNAHKNWQERSARHSEHLIEVGEIYQIFKKTVSIDFRKKFQLF